MLDILKNFLVYCSVFLTSKHRGVVEIEIVTVLLIAEDWDTSVSKSERTDFCSDFLIANCHIVAAVRIPIFR